MGFAYRKVMTPPQYFGITNSLSVALCSLFPHHQISCNSFSKVNSVSVQEENHKDPYVTSTAFEQRGCEAVKGPTCILCVIF
jgi:hypothetical protein